MKLSISLFLWLATTASTFSSKSSGSLRSLRSILITGANKGQGYALAERILTEHDDTRVFLCSRNVKRGEEAAEKLRERLKCTDSDDALRNDFDRVHVVQLDVTSQSSVCAAVEAVGKVLSRSGDSLYGVVSNAGILWGYPLDELVDVCATGVRRVCDAFLKLLCNDGRIIIVSSGLGPLMHGYSSEERQNAMMDPSCSWESTLQPMIDECLETFESSSTAEERREKFESIGFPGGPFAEAVPDFHMYGLAKMFGDAYMKCLARTNPNLRVNSCDPGLVYTDLILKMPRYAGMKREETNGAQTPQEGVEAAMRLLFHDIAASNGDKSGNFYAMSKDKTELLHSDISKMPGK